MDNKKKVNVQYNVLTWGPCVVKMKMTDDFHELLLKEAEASQDPKNLYQHRLAGIIQKEYQFKDKSNCYPTYKFPPHEAMIIMFPGNLLHRVNENKSEGERISVAFNIDFK